MANKFFWYDLMTTDTQAAAKFYAAVNGWQIQDSGVPDSNYTLFTVNGEGRLGLMPIPEEVRKAGVPPCWMGYVAVDDVDKAATKLTQLGGKVERPPVEIPGVIKFCVVSDPQGAGFLIAKGLSREAMPEAKDGTIGTVGWHELYAVDGKSIFEFYEKMFGWTKADAVDMGPMGTYQLFKTGGANAAGGIMNKPPMMPVAAWGYYFYVSEINAAAGRVTANGGKIVNGPMQVPGGQWMVQCQDPQGAMFALVTQRA